MSFTWRCLLPHTEATPTHLARSSHAVAFLPNPDTLYLYGGEHTPRVPVDTHLYTLALSSSSSSSSWVPVELAAGSPVPPERIAPGLAALDGKLWVFGGRMGITVRRTFFEGVGGGVGWEGGVFFGGF